MKHFFITFPVLGFLVLTFIISSVSFFLMVKVPGAQTPESSKGLPIWLIAIWSPTLSAAISWCLQNTFLNNLSIAFSLPPFSFWLLISILPLIIAALILFMSAKNGIEIHWSNFKWNYLVPLILINLIMGPMGEELGWRSFLYPLLGNKYGWMGSALIVGIIWSIWHAPLWWIESPQSNIPFLAFMTNVICLSILMGLIYNHSNGSVLPVIFLHLTFNLSLGVIEILESHSQGEFVVQSLYIYIPLTLVLVGIHESVSTKECLF